MDNQTDQKQTRPDLLKVICILSFIGGGMSFLSYSILYLTIDVWREAFQQGLFDFIIRDEQQEQTFELLMSLSPNYFLIQALLFLASVYGVFKMWNLQKVGFHIYTVSQILLLITLQIFVPSAPFPFFPLLLTASFVFLYFRTMVFMK